MRVLSVAFADIAVGTPESGGAEQILSIVERGLLERGCESVVIARKGSRVAGELVETDGTVEGHQRAIASVDADLIHFHGLDFHRYIPDGEIPRLATLHLPIAFYPASIFEPGRVMLNCVSRSQAASASVPLAVVMNGIATESYRVDDPDGSLLWMGRICPEKAPHIALQIAHRLDARLIVAGPVQGYAAHREYLAREVQPLFDEKRVYAGAAGSEQKRRLLARARCLLVTSLVAETSSLVSMEAMSCGTPVIAFRTGALPEIVEHGRTGFVVDSADEMADAIRRVDAISREECRTQAIRRFDAARMVDEYVDIYRSMMTRHLGIGCAPHENL